MISAFLIKPGVIELRDIPVPRPKKGEVLVKVKSALTCGTDLKAFLRGHPMIPMPGPMGHEFSGVVEAVGGGADKFKPGDRIMSSHSAPCLKCAYCKKSAYNLCENIMRTKVMGAFSQFITIPAHIVKQNAYKIPRGLSFEEAALLEPLSCVMHSVRPLNVKKGDTALVIGAGPIGLMHVMLLKNAGARVAVSDMNESRLKAALKAGAVKTVLPGSIKDAVKSVTKSLGFDFVFECTGLPEVWESGVDYLRRGGVLTLFGGCKSGTTVTFDTHRLHYDELTLRGDFHFTPADVRAAYEILKSRRLDTRLFITGRCGLDGLSAALHALSRGEGIKYAIMP